VDKLFSKLRIGEKIGLGFALVGLLFVGVVWHDRQTLQGVLGDYQQLQGFGLRKSLALEIEIELAAVRDAEKGFLLDRREAFRPPGGVCRGGQQALAEPARQGRGAGRCRPGLAANRRLSAGAGDYLPEELRHRRRSLAGHGSRREHGLQGAFRKNVHRLQELSAGYNVDRLYTLLLQIRRSEKDIALRQDPAYRERVRKLLAELQQAVETSELQTPVRQQLLSELAAYASTFEPYAESALKAGNINGGKGPFRDAAHRIEALLQAYHVANLEASVLQLRRREKDFLLRGDDSYPPMVVEIATTIRAQIAASALSNADKALLTGLLQDYQRDFLALVAQSASISVLTREMNEAAERIAPLVKQNVDQANQMMAARLAEIEVSSAATRFHRRPASAGA